MLIKINSYLAGLHRLSHKRFPIQNATSRNPKRPIVCNSDWPLTILFPNLITRNSKVTAVVKFLQNSSKSASENNFQVSDV